MPFLNKAKLIGALKLPCLRAGKYKDIRERRMPGELEVRVLDVMSRLVAVTALALASRNVSS